jgi:hypothetical protein
MGTGLMAVSPTRPAGAVAPTTTPAGVAAHTQGSVVAAPNRGHDLPFDPSPCGASTPPQERAVHEQRALRGATRECPARLDSEATSPRSPGSESPAPMFPLISGCWSARVRRDSAAVVRAGVRPGGRRERRREDGGARWPFGLMAAYRGGRDQGVLGFGWSSPSTQMSARSL